jgi:hypothetical protein
MTRGASAALCASSRFTSVAPTLSSAAFTSERRVTRPVSSFTGCRKNTASPNSGAIAEERRAAEMLNSECLN